MAEANQQLESQSVQQTTFTDLNARASGKPKTREVQSRYLHAKPAPAARSGTGIKPSGRYSLAGCNSTGWVELQLDQHSTPLMVNTGTQSAIFTQTSKARQAQMRATPASGTGRRTLQHQAMEQQQRRQLLQQRQQQRNLYASADSVGRPHHAAACTPATACGQQPDTEAVPDTGYQDRDMPMTVSSVQKSHVGLISPGSSRSSTSCSNMLASQARVPEPAPSHAESAELFTPQVSRLSASMLIGPSTAVKLNRLGMSTGLAGLPSQARTASKGAEDRRRMLEEYRQQKKLQQQQVAHRNAARGSQGGFKEPQPKSLTQGAKGPPTVNRAGSADLVTHSRASSASAGNDNWHSAADSSASPSQFTATMQTLQQTGSGSKPSKSVSGSKSVRPSGVPLLQMEKIHQAAGGTPTRSNTTPVQRQQIGRSPLVPPSSGSRIPQLHLSSQQPEASTPPLSSRLVNSAAHVPLPDATPRAIRDAAPSKLPKTPRGMPTPRRATDDDDVAAHAARPAVPGLRLGGLAGRDTCYNATVPADAGSTARHNTERSSHLTAAGNFTATTALVGTGTVLRGATVAPSPPSARKTSVITSSRQSGRYASSSSSSAVAAAQQQPEPSRILKTPRMLPTSRGPAETSAASRKAEQDRVDETKQQLRLLRNQNLQLRHLAARIEQAVQQKRDKASSVLAAAAAAITDMYSQLTAIQKQAQQQQWCSELSLVLKRQLPRLQKWSSLQAQHREDLSQLQHACSSALSHVPLLNGASLGQHTDQPDLQLLQHQLVHGMRLLQEVQPALQQLLGPDLLAAQSSDGIHDVSKPTAQLNVSNGQCDIRHSVSTTALLAEQLMSIAAEECCLLRQLAQQAECLSDLHLYANSMQVQLSQMQLTMDPA